MDDIRQIFNLFKLIFWGGIIFCTLYFISSWQNGAFGYTHDELMMGVTIFIIILFIGAKSR